MAKKRKIASKTTSKTATRKSRKPAAPSKAAVKNSPATKSRKFRHDDQISALVIAVVIVIAFVALYLYQNAKPKTALLDGGAAVTTIVLA